MVLYVDVVFLENSIINFFILELVCFILKDKKNFIRIIISSCIGSLFSIVSFLINIGFISNIIYKFFVSTLMILIAFNRRNFIRKIVFFYLVTFALGGVCFGFIYLGNFDEIYISNGILISNFSVLRVIMAVFLGICFVKVAFYILKKFSVNKDLIYEVEIRIGEKVGIFKVLMDSGNLLKEPITGKPVIVVEKSSLKRVFGENFFDDFDNKRFYVIPYSSLGNESSVLIGFSCDYVKIFNNEENMENLDVVIGVYDGEICSSEVYCGLIGTEVL